MWIKFIELSNHCFCDTWRILRVIKDCVSNFRMVSLMLLFGEFKITFLSYLCYLINIFYKFNNLIFKCSEFKWLTKKDIKKKQIKLGLHLSKINCRREDYITIRLLIGIKYLHRFKTSSISCLKYYNVSIKYRIMIIHKKIVNKQISIKTVSLGKYFIFLVNVAVFTD